MPEERRKTPRIRVYLPLRLHQPGAPQVIETLTKDLGVGGLRCVSQNACPVSTKIRLELMFTSGYEPLSIIGRMSWFRALPESEQYDLGIAFLDMTAQDERRLSAYIRHLSEQPTHTSV